MSGMPLDIETLIETHELECKLAGGKNGQGKLPNDFWPTYSAFANTNGGIVLLGIKEKPPGNFFVQGVLEAEKVITGLFNDLNNPQKVSCNVVSDNDVEKCIVDGKTVIKITVRRALRHEKPVHIGSSPFSRNTYRRLHEGDRACDDEIVRRMLAEQVEDERDRKILEGFSIEDIDQRSLNIYRQMLRDTKGATHPFLSEDNAGLLTKIKGWRKDRQTGEEGLTLAGVLMFGTWDAIQEAAPHYFIDYQERPEARTDSRWVDRVFPDGTWSGNLFDFYRIVYRKLTDPETLKIPFRLEDGQRKDDTPVHEAIREALVNTIIHADYTGRLSVLVVKRPDMIGFRNPGDMRIPPERAVLGGDSDGRNRIMQQMFLMIGLGERAGSGVRKIYSGWDWRHWRKPALYEKQEPAQTLLELRMLELMPEGILGQLQDELGEIFNSLSQLERLILATAATEQVVSNKRVNEICADHTHDISLALRSLVKNELLSITGQGRGAVYSLPGQELPTPEQVFAGSSYFGLISSSDDLGSSSEDKALSSEDSAYYSEDKLSSSEDIDSLGRLMSDRLSAPVVHNLSELTSEFLNKLESIAQEPRVKKRLDKNKMREVIVALCCEQFVTRQCLAELVKRDPDSLRQQYLTDLVDEKVLRLAFPQSPTHSRQAYITI